MKILRITLIMFIFSITTFAYADGSSFLIPDDSSSNPILQNEQRAAIAFDGKTEKMTIAINISPKDTQKVLWIFPVPSELSSIKIDVMDEFPAFSGLSTIQRQYIDVHSICLLLRGLSFHGILLEETYFLPTLGDRMGCKYIEDKIKTLEKYGITCDVVKADNIDQLHTYTESIKYPVTKKDLDSFSSYFNSKFSFVVCRISSQKKLERHFGKDMKNNRRLGKWPCIQVKFPSKKAYYPMKATWQSSSKHFKFLLFINGFHTIRSKTLKKSYNTGWFRSNLSNGFVKTGEIYTRISSYANREIFNDDLLFSDKLPFMTGLRIFLTRFFSNKYILLIMIFLILTLSSGIAGKICFNDFSGFFFLGLWNIFTMYTLMDKLLQKIKQKGIDNELDNYYEKHGFFRFLLLISPLIVSIFLLILIDVSQLNKTIIFYVLTYLAAVSVLFNIKGVRDFFKKISPKVSFFMVLTLMTGVYFSLLLMVGANSGNTLVSGFSIFIALLTIISVPLVSITYISQSRFLTYYYFILYFTTAAIEIPLYLLLK